MKLFKTNRNKLIAIMLVIASLSALFATVGNAYQMGGPQYFTNSSGTKLYRIYLWNEDPSNPTSTTPYKIHADLELMNSTYTFAVICAGIKKEYTGLGYTDKERDNFEFYLSQHEMCHRESPNGSFSASTICNSSHSSVTDDYTDTTGRVFHNTGYNKPVLATAQLIVGTLNGSGNYFYTYYAGGGVNYSQSPTFSYNSNNIGHYDRLWHY